MTFRDYPLNKEVADVLEIYARDNSLHISSILEELVKGLLFDEGYLVVDEKVTLTPEEMYTKRRDKFSAINKGRYFQLYYDDLNFGVFEKREIEEVIDSLLDFSDEELVELSKNQWKYSDGKYKRFIRQKLDDPLLTVKEFLAHNKLNRRNRKGDVTFEFEGKMIARFNRDKISSETIENAYLILNNLSDEELLEIPLKRKERGMNSSDFILEYIGNSDNDFKRPKYVYKNTSGGYYIRRNEFNFGTHTFERITEVWNFLDSKNWDKSYSLTERGLARNEYREWLYSEMKKEGY